MTFSVENWTARQLDKIKKLIGKRDRDYVLIIDGEEGCGKSTLACQIAKYVDPSFNESRMCLRPQDFREAVVGASKGQAVVFDEAFTGLASRSVMTEINKSIVELMMEMRKKNLFVIIVIPSFFYLERYVALHRARCLFHCRFNKGRSGKYLPYNQRKLRQLYLFGKKKMSYKYPHVYTNLNFYKSAPIDWVKYENKKISALQSKIANTRADKWRMQRDLLIKEMHERGVSLRKMENIFESAGLSLAHTSMSEQLVKSQKENYKTPYKTPNNTE